MAIELAAAYISILPSTDKLAPGIQSALSGSMKLGETAGKALGVGISSGLKKGAQDSQTAITGALRSSESDAVRSGKRMGNSLRSSITAGIRGIDYKSTFTRAEAMAKASGKRIKDSLTPKEKSGGGVGASIGAAGAALAGVGILASFKGIISGASDAQQSIGATETVFGKYSKSVIDNSKKADKAYGLSANTYRENANLLGALLANQGVSADKLAGKTQQLIGIGSDLAATYGGTTTDAVEALSAAFKGEFDSLEKYGISVKQETINQEAYRVAHVKTASEFGKLTTAQQNAAKQQATTNLITQQSAKAQGAFGRETDTLAHKQQVFSAQLQNTKDKVGGVLLPIMTKFFGFLSERLLPKIVSWGNTFKTELLPAIQNVAGWIKDHLQPPLTAIGTWMTQNGPTVKAFAITVGILATAIGLWATVQWLLNSALLASPITWIVLGIGALVGAVVYAWTHFEGFRKVVLGVWAGIQSAIGFAWNNVIKPVFAALSWFVSNVLAPVFTWLWGSIIKPYFTLIGNIIKGVWDRFIHPILQLLAWTISNVVAPAISWFYDKVIKPVFGAIGKFIGYIWRTGIKPYFESIANFITDTVVPAFKKGVGILGVVWEGIKTAFLSPVNFVIDVIYNNGIRKLINALPGVDDLAPMALLGGAGSSGGGTKNQKNRGRDLGFAAGGPVTGGVPGKDSVRAWLMPGEHVWTADEVKAAGGQGAMFAMRKLVKRKGGIGESFDPPAFANGGTLDPAAIARAKKFAQDHAGDPYGWGAVGPSSFDCSGFMSALTNVLRGKNPFSRVGATGNFPWSGFDKGPGQFTIGSTKSYAGGVGHMAGTLDGMNVESRGGRGVVLGSAARGYNDPGFDTVAHLGAAGTDGGFLSSVAGVLKSLKGWIAELGNMGGFSGLIKQMVQGVGGQLTKFINDKVPGPGPLNGGIFDSGGILEPGHFAFNASTKPEAVFTNSQFAEYSKNNGSQPSFGRYEFVISNWNTGEGYFREIAGEEIDAYAGYKE